MLPLLVGLVIYIFLRSGTFINHFFEKTGFLKPKPSDDFFIAFIRFNLPDFLRAYSLTAALVFWKLYKGRVDCLFIFVVLIFLAGTEFVQLGFRIGLLLTCGICLFFSACVCVGKPWASKTLEGLR